MMSCNVFQYCNIYAQFYLEIAPTAKSQFYISMSWTGNPISIEFYLLGFLCSAYIHAPVI